MKQTVLSILFLVLLISSVYAQMPRAYYQQVVAGDTSVDLRTIVTNSNITANTLYTVTCDILETPGDSLSTATHSPSMIGIFKRGTAPNDWVTVFVQLGSFSLGYYPGQTVRWTVTYTSSGTYNGQSTTWDYVIPTGTAVINIMTPTQNVPPVVMTDPQPFIAHTPNPANLASNVSTNVGELNWSYTSNPDYTDPSGYRVYFGPTYPPTSVSYHAGMYYTTRYLSPLDPYTTYYWQVVPYNASGDAQECPIWEFTTAAAVPPTAVTPINPADAASNVGLSTSFSWNPSDGSETGYKLYLGTDNPPTNLISGLDVGNVTEYSMTQPLALGTNYFWKIIPYSSYGEPASCPVWSFSTPGGNPENNAAGISIYTDLSWQVGTPTFIMGYYLYFGTDNPPTNIVNDAYISGSSLSYDLLPTLAYNTNYYWQLIPFQSMEQAQYCPIWEFTTEPEPYIPPQPPQGLWSQFSYTVVGGVHLEWNPPYTSTPDSYRLYRQFDTLAPQLIAAGNILSYDDRVNRVATYWVTALYGENESDPSNMEVFTPQAHDYNDLVLSASIMEVPQTGYSANLFPSGDIDYYQFQVGEDLYSYSLQIAISCPGYESISMQASLYGPYAAAQDSLNDASLVASDISSGSDLLPLIRTSVLGRPGFYYLKINTPAELIKSGTRTGMPNDYGDYELNITLLEVPIASVSVKSLNMIASATETPTDVSGTFYISSIGGATLHVQTSASDTSWMTCTPATDSVIVGDTRGYTVHLRTDITPGSYTGTIFITTDDGLNPNQQVAVIYQLDRQIFKAQFVASDTLGSAPLTVNFTDQSYVDIPDRTINSWYWLFGDGNNSSEQNPTHIYNTIGQYDVSLTVSYDEVSGPDSMTYSHTTAKVHYIQVTNAPPVVSHQLDDVIIAEDSTFVINLTGAFTEPDGQSLSYVFRGSDHYTIAGAGMSFTVTPSPNWNGADSIWVTASDGFGGAVSQSFALHVTPVNDVPQYNSVPTSITFDEDTEDTSLHLNDFFYDPDGDPLHFAFSGVVHITIYEIDGNIRMIPDANWSGTENINFIAIDPYEERTFFTIEVTVSPVNDVLSLNLPPTIYFNMAAEYSFDVRPYITGTDWPSQFVTITTTSNLTYSVTGTVISLTSAVNHDFVENVIIAVSDTLAREIVTDMVEIHVIAQGTGVSNTDSLAGSWDTSGSPFYVMGGLNIPPDGTLTIDSGVEVNFLADSTFTVNGNLVADSVSFGTVGGGTWGGLVFGAGSDDSNLNNCFIYNALQPLLIDGSNVVIDSCTIETDSTNTTPTGAAILVTGGGSPLLTNLTINNYDQGIVIENNGARTVSTPTLSNLRIRNSTNTVRTDAIGVLLSGDVDASLDSLVIENYNFGIRYLRGNLPGGRTTPTLSNLRIRSSSNTTRALGTAIYLENMAGVIIENDSIGNYQKGIEIVNLNRGTATPTISNLRIRNSSNTSRIDNYGIVLTGNVIAQITNSVIEEVMYGIRYAGSGIPLRTTPTLSNLRIRNSTNTRANGNIGIYLSGLPVVSVVDDSISGFNQGLVIEETARGAESTPTLSNLRIRTSSNSQRIDTIGILLQGSVDARMSQCDIDEFDVGIKYIRNVNRIGTTTPSLSNLRVRNSTNSGRLPSIGMYLENLDKVIMMGDSISGYPVGIQFHNTVRATTTPTISNLRIRSSSNSARNTGTGLILEESAKGFIRNSWIEGFATGILIPDGNRMRFTSNVIKNCTVGMDVNGTSALPEIDHNQLYLTNSYFIGNPGTSNWAISIANSDSMVVRNNTINQYSHALKLADTQLLFEQNIVWSNLPSQLPFEMLHTVMAANYNDINFDGGIYPGTGNINSHPLFADVIAENFNLTVDSPCIDSGDPIGKRDEDDTIADMGALPYLHRAGFISDKRFETIGETIQFSSRNTGHDPLLSTYAWDFENDGNWDSNEMNPSHTYPAAGVFSVKLRVQTSTLADSTVQTNYIIIQNSALTAPQNMHITSQNNNLTLSWNPVVHDQQGNDVNVNYYLVYHSNDPKARFDFLATTEGQTSYVHTGILNQDLPHFYFVVGFVGSREEMRQYVDSHRTKLWQSDEVLFTKPLERK